MGECQQFFPTDVWVSVRQRRSSVRSPASVANTNSTFGRRLVQFGCQRSDPSNRFDDLQLLILIQRSSARTVVTAVLETFKTFEQEILSRLAPDISNDATQNFEVTDRWGDTNGQYESKRNPKELYLTRF